MPYTPPGQESKLRIPTADPDGNSLDNCPLKNVHFRWLDSRDSDRFGLHLVNYGGRPGYTLAARDTVKGTKKLAVELGFSEHHVDEAANRIHVAELVLAYIPIEEWHRRQAERLGVQQDRQAKARAAYEDTINALPTDAIKPVVKEVGQIADERAFAEREDRPIAGQVGGSRDTPAAT